MADEKEVLDQDNTIAAEDQLKDALTNMVPKTELEKAKNDYNRLYQKVLSGEFSGVVEPKEDAGKKLEDEYKAAMDEMVNHKTTSACKHAEDLLKIDDYFVSKGQRSVFEASNGDRDFNGARASAQRTRELLEYALEEANGDDNLFVARISNALRDRN